MLNDKRKMWKFVVFGILTAGIYDIWFLWTMVNDLNTSCGYVEKDEKDRSPHYLLLCLFTLLTVGIYTLYWYYKQGNRIKSCGDEYGLKINESGSTYLLWALVGSLLFGLGPFIALCMFVSNINKLCSVYNYKKNNPTPEIPGIVSRDIPPVSDNPPGTTVPAGKQTGLLRCIKGSIAGAEIELLSGQELLIGRSGEYSQLVLAESDISRKHCSVRFQADEQVYYVTDFSTYGVLVNDSHPLAKGLPTRVPLGTTLTLGTGSNVFMLQ